MRVNFTVLPTSIIPVNKSMTKFSLEGELVFTITDPVTESYSEVTIPDGFVTDFATVPKFLRNFLPPMGRYSWAAVVHDYLLQMGYDRDFCRIIFRLSMENLGVGRVRKNTLVLGVWYWDKIGVNLKNWFNS